MNEQKIVQQINATIPEPLDTDDIKITSFITINGKTGVTSTIFKKQVFENYNKKLLELLSSMTEKAIPAIINTEGWDDTLNRNRYARTYRISDQKIVDDPTGEKTDPHFAPSLGPEAGHINFHFSEIPTG